MADQFQYVSLPDGSYGKFNADASDDVIRGAIQKDFPDAFRSVQSPIAPPKLQKSNPTATGMHKSFLVGDENENADDAMGPVKSTANAVVGAVAPAARLTKTGYQAMAKGMTGGRHAPLGEPQSPNQTIRDAGDVGMAMATGMPEDSIAAPSAAVAAPDSTASRLVRSTDRASGAATPAGGGSIKPILEAAGHLPIVGKYIRGANMVGKLVKKMSPDAESDAAAAEPLPHPLAGKGIHGTPVSEWGKQVQPPVSATPRPEPAWKQLQRPDPATPNAKPQVGLTKLEQKQAQMRLRRKAAAQ